MARIGPSTLSGALTAEKGAPTKSEKTTTQQRKEISTQSEVAAKKGLRLKSVARSERRTGCVFRAAVRYVTDITYVG